MRRALFVPVAALSFAVPVPARADNINPNLTFRSMLRHYDLDGPDEIGCASIGRANAETGGSSSEPDYKGAKQAKSDGSSTTWTSKDAGAGAFASVLANDIIAFYNSANDRQERVVIEASNDSITVDEAGDLGNGSDFYFRRPVCGTSGTSGEIRVAAFATYQMKVHVRQMDATSVTVRMQGRGETTDFIDITTPAVITVAGDCIACSLTRHFNATAESYFAIRTLISIQSDDGDDTGTHAEQIEYEFSGTRKPGQ